MVDGVHSRSSHAPSRDRRAIPAHVESKDWLKCYICYSHDVAMEVIITEWALDSYLELVHRRVFDRAEYRSTIRPDVDRLNSYPNDPRFSQQQPI